MLELIPCLYQCVSQLTMVFISICVSGKVAMSTANIKYEKVACENND